MINEFVPGRWYAIGSRAYQVLVVEDGRLIVRYHGDLETSRLTISIQAKVAEPVDDPATAYSPALPARNILSRRQQNETSTFQLKETTPIVVELIRKNGHLSGDFLTHEEIVELILGDSKGRHLVDSAVRLGNPDPPAEIAGNMLAFLGKEITEGKSEYAGQLERKKIGGKWAYRAG